MCEQNKTQAQEELKQKTVERDMSGVQNIKEIGRAIEEGAVSAYQKIEDGVVGGYQKIEDAVVGGYKKIENGVVEGFTKMTDRFVEKLFAHDGETVEEAKKRLNGEKLSGDQ